MTLVEEKATGAFLDLDLKVVRRRRSVSRIQMEAKRDEEKEKQKWDVGGVVVELLEEELSRL